MSCFSDMGTRGNSARSWTRLAHGKSVALGSSAYVVVLYITSILYLNHPTVILTPLFFAILLAISRRCGFALLTASAARYALRALVVTGAAALTTQFFCIDNFTFDSMYLTVNSRLLAQNMTQLVALNDSAPALSR